MASQYAKTTRVPVQRSRNEIETTLERYGCEAFSFLKRGDDCVIQFEHGGRTFRIPVDGGETDQETRQRWRVVLLWLKACLELVENGQDSFDVVFAMWTALPDGSTLGDTLVPQLDKIAEGGNLPRLMG